MPMEERKPLSLVTKICYGLSGMAQLMYWNVYGAYTNIFLVEIAQLPPLFGTSAVFGGRALDAVCNFILGPLIDKTDTRWGKLKPWILGAGVLLVPIYMLVWYVPDVGLEGKLAWYIFLYILLMFAKTALAVSSHTYVMLLSPDSQDRDSATAYRGLFSLIGITAGIAIHGQIVSAYGQGQADPCSVTLNGTNNTANITNSTIDYTALAEEKTGYLISAGVISALTLACVLAVTLGTTERKDISNAYGQQHDQSTMKMLRSVLTFRPNVFMLLIIFCVQLALAILLGAAVLYVQYGLDLPDQIHNTMLTFAISAVLPIPAMGSVVARFGKRRPLMCCQLALIPSTLGFLFIPSRSVASALIICAFLGLAGSSGFFLPWAMLNDVAEEYSLRTGRTLDTWFYSIALSTNSLCTTLGHGLTTIALEIGGYKTGECVQPDSVGSSLRLLSIFPAVLSLLCVGLLWKYPLTEDRQRQIKEELENRKTSSEEDPTQRWKESNGDALHPGHSDVRGTIEEEILLSPESDLSELVECRETVL